MNEESIVEQPTTDSTAEITPEAHDEMSHNGAVEKVFTQEEVNALLARESSKLRRKLKKQTRNVQEEVPESNNALDMVSSSLDKIVSRLEKLETMETESGKQRAFDNLVGDRKIDDDLKSVLYATFDPSDTEKTISVLDKVSSPNSVPQENRYRSPGAPTTTTDQRDNPNPMAWSKDDINVLVKEGRFLDSVEKWRETLPGGGSNLFSRKLRKK